jgi:hypothetical protein
LKDENVSRLAEYQVTEALSKSIKTAVPTIEELEAELTKDFAETKVVTDPTIFSFVLRS